MTITGKLYGNFLSQALNKEHDWDSDSYKCMLTTLTYTPDQDVHAYKSSVTNEVTGTGYTAGGAVLASPTRTYTAATNVITLSAANVSWASSTITARTAVVYNDTPALDTAKGLVCYQQSDADIASTGGTFTVQWAASGIVQITVA